MYIVSKLRKKIFFTQTRQNKKLWSSILLKHLLESWHMNKVNLVVMEVQPSHIGVSDFTNYEAVYILLHESKYKKLQQFFLRKG